MVNFLLFIYHLSHKFQTYCRIKIDKKEYSDSCARHMSLTSKYKILIQEGQLVLIYIEHDTWNIPRIIYTINIKIQY